MVIGEWVRARLRAFSSLGVVRVMSSNRQSSESELPERTDDSGHLTRRASMKAAVAGGAAAVAWAAPRIEGFSIAPDFAAAASCVTGNSNTTFNTTRYSSNCFTNNCCDACVNGTGGNNGGCNFGLCDGSGCGNTARTGTLTIPRNGGGGSVPFTFNYSFIGSAWNGGASMNGTLAGVDPPFVNCSVTLNGSCADTGGGGGCSFGTGSGYTKNGNGAASTGIDFNCNGFGCSENNRCNNNSITLSLTLSCTCL